MPCLPTEFHSLPVCIEVRLSLTHRVLIHTSTHSARPLLVVSLSFALTAQVLPQPQTSFRLVQHLYQLVAQSVWHLRGSRGLRLDHTRHPLCHFPDDCK